MEFLKNRLTWLVFAVIIVIFFQLYISGKISFKIEKYELVDECGRTLNGAVSHTIPNDSACKVMCYNQCGTVEKDLLDYYFNIPVEGCHECSCRCR